MSLLTLFHNQGKGTPIGGAKSYIDKVLAVDRANLLTYWPLNEKSGSIAYNLEGTSTRDGTYTGVTLGHPGIGDGNTCPLFDGANDYVNVFSTSLRDEWSDEMTFAVWCKVFNASVWTDGTSRAVSRMLGNVDNQLLVRKSTPNNLIQTTYEGGNTSQSADHSGLSTVDWMHFAITWSLTNSEVVHYKDGALFETDPPAAAWDDPLNSTDTCLGALNTTPAGVWNGWIAHAALWSTPLTLPQIKKLATV